jgi:hypothetical protein
MDFSFVLSVSRVELKHNLCSLTSKPWALASHNLVCVAGHSLTSTAAFW